MHLNSILLISRSFSLPQKLIKIRLHLYLFFFACGCSHTSHSPHLLVGALFLLALPRAKAIRHHLNTPYLTSGFYIHMYGRSILSYLFPSTLQCLWNTFSKTLSLHCGTLHFFTRTPALSYLLSCLMHKKRRFVRNHFAVMIFTQNEKWHKSQNATKCTQLAFQAVRGERQKSRVCKCYKKYEEDFTKSHCSGYGVAPQQHSSPCHHFSK